MVLTLAGVLTWALWPGEEPRSRQYREAVACLLTDDQGLRGAQAAEVWSGMQDASLETLARVQYLTVDGAQTVENARGLLNSQIQSRCSMVLAVGEAPGAAVREAAPVHPGVMFVLFGDMINGAPKNLSVMKSSRGDVHDVLVDEMGSDLR
ncbi:hypothetical protein [Catellatospora sp. TT07R-123]|uniref:hypothetical protein n=1 Tax=Catellatospora sp. TT07R-123 TaxID=2733863 RepID=UPI001BB33F3F|nr:hypothetical protein [Catellatospora sp. TT07R-123]